MTTRGVELKILGNSTSADKALAEVTGGLDKLRERFAKSLDVNIGDKEGLLKLRKIEARMERLSEKTASPRITVKGIDRAITEAMALDVELDKLGRKTVDAKVKVKESHSGGIGGLGGLLEKGTSLLSLGGESLGGTGGGVASIAAIAAIAQGLGVATVAATGLAAAFAPLAGSILPKITAQWSTFSKMISGTKAGKQAIGAASEAFHALLAAITPLVIKMLPSLTRLFNNIGKSATSGGLSQFLTWLATHAPPAFDAVAKGARFVGKAIHAIAPWVHIAGDDFGALFHLIDAGIDLVIGAIELFTGHWSRASQRFSAVGHNIAAAFHDVVDAIKTEIGIAVNFMGGFPARILHALGNLGHLLYSAGENIIDGLISGIESKIGPLGGVMQRVLSVVGDFLPHSPAKRGPLSGSGSPQIAGAKIATMLATGITQGGPHVANAANGLAQHVANSYGASASHYGGNGSKPLEITLNISGNDKDLIGFLAKRIRVSGGDPRVLTQKVVFA